MDDEVTEFPPTVRQAGDPRKDATWTLMPVGRPNLCSQCAIEHEPDQPHNQQSMHYQYAFYAEYERWPTWEDAMAHCDVGTQELWKAGLRKLGVEI